MQYRDWPDYVRKRYALDHIILRTEIAAAPARSASSPREIAASDVLGWLYGVLTILDGKASALMRMNGVLIAAAAFLLGLFERTGGTILRTTSFDAQVIVLSALLSSISICCCLLVVRISWGFLGKVESSDGDAYDCTNELVHLDRACRFRQWVYRGAWWTSVAASILFLGDLFVQTVHVIRHAAP